MSLIEWEHPLDEKYEEIARHLPDEWTFERVGDWEPTISGPNGMRLRLEAPFDPTSAERAYVAGDLPGEHRLRVDQLLEVTLFINMYQSSASYIARRIRDDLLPRYLPAYEKSLAHYREQIARQQRADLLQRVKDRCPKGFDAHITECSPERVSVRLTLSEAEASAVFDALDDAPAIAAVA